MALLLINTCEAACVCLVRYAGQDFSKSTPMRTGHDRQLATHCETVITNAGLIPSQISKIAVAVGPGSFTGVRIGVAFARGLALAVNSEIIGMHLLQPLANLAHRQNPNALSIAVRSVGRGQIAWCSRDQNGWAKLPVAVSADQILQEINQLAQGRNIVFAGDEIDQLPNHFERGPVDCSLTELADYAEKQTDDPLPASPWYARPPDAKLPGGISPWG